MLLLLQTHIIAVVLWSDLITYRSCPFQNCVWVFWVGGCGSDCWVFQMATLATLSPCHCFVFIALPSLDEHMEHDEDDGEKRLETRLSIRSLLPGASHISRSLLPREFYYIQTLTELTLPDCDLTSLPTR